jgi:hypothetical protein
VNKLLRIFALTVAFLALRGNAFAFDQWIAPTPEELSMTSIPQVPGAPALYLYKEQTAEDSLRMWSYYVRLKVLTEGGKDLANVELPYFAGNAGWSIDSIAARTVHADGSIVPFTGKAYDKLVEKAGGYKLKVKVFTLPAVEVGSILEYRYKLHYDDAYFSSPDWFIQTDLYTRKAHYSWKPTTENVVDSADGGQLASTIAWTPLLPPGAMVKEVKKGNVDYIVLDIDDVPPLPKEDMAPPVNSVSYRVLFYYTPYRAAADYWKNMGKRWVKARDKFVGPGSLVKSTVNGLVQPSDTEEQKLRKIYAAVTALENTDFSREHTIAENRAQGLKKATSTNDILARKRGNGDQLTMLFVSMARAAGMKAYVMGVANRNERYFLANYLSLQQIDDDIAIVPVGGKDMYFDPGQRYCAFGHLAWRHTLTGGLRETDSGIEIGVTPGEGYKDAHISRIADLTLDEHGVASGSLILTFTGDPALRWRQQAAKGDDTSLNLDLRTSMEQMLPGGMEVRVVQVDNLTDSEKPLTVKYEVKGAIGAPTGKRLLVTANLFEANTKTSFTSTKRELPLDFQYATVVQDAVRYKLPPSLVIESSPAADQIQLKNAAVFTTSAKTAGNSVTLFRNFTRGKVTYPASEYADVREFYSKVQAKDQESLVLTRPAVAPTPGTK